MTITPQQIEESRKGIEEKIQAEVNKAAEEMYKSGIKEFNSKLKHILENPIAYTHGQIEFWTELGNGRFTKKDLEIQQYKDAANRIIKYVKDAGYEATIITGENDGNTAVFAVQVNPCNIDETLIKAYKRAIEPRHLPL